MGHTRQFLGSGWFGLTFGLFVVVALLLFLLLFLGGEGGGSGAGREGLKAMFTNTSSYTVLSWGKVAK